MMPPDKQKNFEWYAAQLAQLSIASQSLATRDIASAMSTVLLSGIVADFPETGTALKVLADRTAAGIRNSMVTKGPELWKQLHTRAKVTPTDPKAEMLFLQQFATQLPCGECKQFYTNYLVSNPPNFADYQGWMIGLHNAVNAKLNKPQMAVDAARALWK